MKSTQTLIAELLEAKVKQADICRATGLPHWTVSRWHRLGPPDAADQALALQDMHAKMARKRKPTKAAA